jgi:hypothetical protein
MSDPVNQHYVAQHVLRRFCDPDGVLWTYDKLKKEIYPARPKSQASGKDYYSFKGKDGTKTTVIELKFLRPIDAAGFAAIERLLRRETLTAEQWVDFMRFAAAQMIRVEAYFQRLSNLFTPLLQESAERMFKYSEEFKSRITQRLRQISTPEETIKELLASLSRGEFKMTANRGYLNSIFLKVLDTNTQDFCRMKWDVLWSENTDKVFLLSDNPLALANLSEDPHQALGIRNPNIEITMPLTPTTVAVAQWNEAIGYGIIEPDYVDVVNQRLIDHAHRYVYASYRSEDLLARVVESQGRQPKTRLKKIKHGDGMIFMNVYSQ